MDRVHLVLSALILVGVALGIAGERLIPGSPRPASREPPRAAAAAAPDQEPPQSPAPPPAATGPAQPSPPPPAPAPVPPAAADTLLGESAIVYNTEGLGLLLRTAADLNAGFVDSLLDGAGVEVQETTVIGDTRWYLVRFGDLSGWVRAQFLRRP